VRFASCFVRAHLLRFCRPTIQEVSEHPVFWTPEEQLNYLKEIWEEKEHHLRKDPRPNWSVELEPVLVAAMEGSYGETLYEQLRWIRNLGEHGIKPKERVCRALQEVMNLHYNPLRNDVMAYVAGKFPSLVLDLYTRYGHSKGSKKV
jgi:hypothetical protein